MTKSTQSKLQTYTIVFYANTVVRHERSALTCSPNHFVLDEEGQMQGLLDDHKSLSQ